MSDTFHDRVRDRLKTLGKSAQRASLDAGLSRDYLRTLFNRPATVPKGDNLQKLAKALDTSAHWLLTGAESAEAPPSEVKPTSLAAIAMPDRTLPVYGLAAGAITGAQVMTSDPFEYVPCPPGLARVRDAYALVVSGASMEPKYRTGDLIFVHPHRPPRMGDHVVVQEAHTGGTATYIKRFERWSDRHLIVTQYNKPSELKFHRDQVVAVHRVLETNELFGI